MEHEGIIYRKQGLGTFVSEDGLSRTRDVKRRRASELMEQAVREAAEAGMSESEILNLAERLIREPQGEESQR